jgi:hypothetical protein
MFARPFYHDRVDTGSYHRSYLVDAGYRDLGKKTTKGKHKLQPGWPCDFTKMPMVKRFTTTTPNVSHRDGQMQVELIGPVHAPRPRRPDQRYVRVAEGTPQADQGRARLAVDQVASRE